MNRSPGLVGFLLLGGIIIISMVSLNHWMAKQLNDVEHDTQAIKTATEVPDQESSVPSGSRYGVPKYDPNSDPMPLDIDRIAPSKISSNSAPSGKPAKVYEGSYNTTILLE